MIIDILKLIKALFACVPFVVMCIVLAKMNLAKEKRYKQIFLPVVALLYCIVAVALLNKISEWILTGIYWLIENVSWLAFLDNLNWASGMVFVLNFALALGFALLKGMLFPFLLPKPKFVTLTDKLSDPFYFISKEDEGKDDVDRRYLRSKFGDAKKIISAMYYAMLVVFVLLLIVTDYLTSYDLLSAPFYPAFGMIVMGEIVAFLSGKTYEEKLKESDDPGPDIKDDEVDYDPIVAKYEDLFGSRVTMTMHTKQLSDASETASDLLNKYKKEYDDTLCQEAGVMYTYYSALEQAGVVLDEAYLRQTRNLLDGKSVVFLTKFYTDTSDYVFLPVVRGLMQKKRILVVMGNSGSADHITEWFESGISGITGFERIWKIAPLKDADASTSVMLLDAKNIYNQKLLSEKSKILSEASMVFILDANKLLGTLQMGLSCLVSYLSIGGNNPQYIIYDRNCDGLVDSLSHVLNQSLVQVNATSIGTARKNAIFWQADGKLLHHKLGLTNARYLGMGTELAILALKEHVSKVVWAASRNFPVTDMSWISSQYYAAICKAAGLKVSQNELSEHIEFVSDPQSISKTDHSFMVVEDEYNNAFEIARQFSTRGREQSFVNVISSRYWLREYMADNPDIFNSDPKSIPTITPDFQRSTGNMVYKMVMRMIEAPVEEKEIRDLLDMLGEDTTAVYKSLRMLILKYCFRIKAEEKDGKRIAEKLDNAVTVRQTTEVDPHTLRSERKRYYSITNTDFVDRFLSQLKIVYYVADEGMDKNSYLDSAMYGHVYQKYLPGMLTTIDGKYYQIISMTKNSGIIVRRAADHITSRRYYRTLRRFNLDCCETKATQSAKHNYGNITLEYIEANVSVDTLGYLEMSEYCDIKKAKRVSLDNIEQREYRAKECLKVRFEGSTPEVRATIATLLNELFVTAFPETHQYITATVRLDSEKALEGCMPELTGVDDDCVYIIEDSLIDLGLLINVERYFVRFLEIICDVLNWHAEKLKEDEPPKPGNDSDPEDEGDKTDGDGEGNTDGSSDNTEETEGGSKWKKWREKQKKKRAKKKEERKKKREERKNRRKKKKNESNDDSNNESNDEETSQSRTPFVSRSSTADRKGSDEPDDSGVTGNDSEWFTVSEDDIEQEKEDLPYSKTHFVLYGFDEVPGFLNLSDTETYLTEQGLADNYLKQARERGKRKKLKWYNFDGGQHCCDFCGAVLEGKFDLLDDGRERCLECSSTAITKVQDFKKLYKKTRKQMEKIFGIKLKEKISIKICNAQELAAALGEAFCPTSGFDSRALGFAVRNGLNGMDMYIENGSPALETEKTLVHELTHIWQYANLPDIFEPRDLVAIEGMAVWAEIQYLVSIGQTERAQAYMHAWSFSDNEYGAGMKKYLAKYQIQDKPKVHRGTPFNCKRNPLK